MQMLSVCRTPAAAGLSRRSLLIKCQLGLLGRLLHRQAGDLGSTFGMALGCLREQRSVKTGVADENTKSMVEGDLLGNTQGCFVCCPCPEGAQPSFEPSAPWFPPAVGHNRNVEGDEASMG